MILGSTALNSNKFQAFKFGDHPVGTELWFYFTGIGRRPGKGQEFDVVEAMAFDPAEAQSKGLEGALASVKYYSFSMQAQIDSFVNGRLDKKTGQRGSPSMFVGKFYKIKYARPQGTEYTDKNGNTKKTESIGYDIEEILVEKGTAEAFQALLRSGSIADAMEAYAQANAGMVQGTTPVSEPNNLPKL